MIWTMKRWWLCYFSGRLGDEMGMAQSPEQRWPSFMQGIVMCTSKSVPIPFMLFQMRILKIPQSHSPYVYIYIYIHPLSPDWSWHFFGASNNLPSHNSDTRLSQGEFLHRNSYPKPFQNPSGRESATKGVKLSNSKDLFPFFLRLALNSYMDRGKSCSKYKGRIREGSKAKCVVCCSHMRDIQRSSPKYPCQHTSW